MAYVKALHDRWKYLTSPTNITESPDIPWTSIGPGRDCLATELERLYWEGVRDELENIIRTLRVWRRNKYSLADLYVYETKNIEGYDTFLDQVNQHVREFALQYGESRVRALKKSEPEKNHTKYSAQDASVSKTAAIKAVVQGAIADRSSKMIGEEVRANIAKIPKQADIIHKLAWRLLQSVGFLDIDKIIEHRQPLDKSEKRPGIPQIVLTSGDKNNGPRYDSLKCVECRTVITASMYSQVPQYPKPLTRTVCESCYWSRHYGDASFTKSYKHSVAIEALSEREAEAKYAGLLASVDTVPLDQKSSLSRGISKAGESFKARRLSASAKLSAVGSSKGQPAASHDAGSDVLPTEDEHIPPFFRQHAKRNPFAGLHMALRIGPLVIENGVSNTHAGALVSLRDIPVFIERFPIRGSHQRALSIGTDAERRVWEQQRVVGTPKHYKAIVKQVVGAPFSGVLSRLTEGDQEQHVLKLVMEASGHELDGPTDSPADQRRKMDERLQPILDCMKTLLQSRLKVYLHHVVQRLLDPNNILTWHPLDNNCRTFCDSLLDHTLYGPLVNGPPQTILGSSPLYLMSFVSPTQRECIKPLLRSKFDVPDGFIDEYMKRLYLGRHNDADMIDSLQEYWHDWSGFSEPPCNHQNAFPWDCSEAYGRCPTTCRWCTLSKHIWACPFDSWSMVTLHLQRDQHQYPGFANIMNRAQLDEWTYLRLSVLQASSLLNRVAAAMSQSTAFVKLSAWLHEPNKGLLQAYPSLSRVRTGGIHRAQPYSHYYDAGVSRNYFRADGATADQYRKLRDARMRAHDIPAAVALRMPKFRTISQRHDGDAFLGFQGADQKDDLLDEGSASYYPYFHAKLSDNATESGWEYADAQLYSLDEIAGDGNLSKGGEYNCASGCGALSKFDIEIPSFAAPTAIKSASSGRRKKKTGWTSSSTSHGGSAYSGCGYGGGGGSGGGGGGGSGGG